MKIISHRGLWNSFPEKNTEVAFKNAINTGYGIETDIRDLDGELVVSHDPPQKSDHLATLDSLISLFSNRDLPLALNIKSDGLSQLIKNKMANYKGEWFTFDMSGPETVRYLEMGVPVYCRHSDIEMLPICYDQCSGVWLDTFNDPIWYQERVINRHLHAGKKVCIVSPELHQYSHEDLWILLKNSGIFHHPDLAICTDAPVKASRYFETNND